MHYRGKIFTIRLFNNLKYPMFLMDIAHELIFLCKDKFLPVKIRTVWALGNLTNVILISSESVSCTFSEDTITQILLHSIDYAGDHEKCRAHAVRTIGNVFRLLSCTFLVAHQERLVKKAILSVLSNVNTGPFKVKVLVGILKIIRRDGMPVVHWRIFFLGPIFRLHLLGQIY